MYCCPVEEPGFLAQPHHIPGYGGHIPSYQQRCGASIGKLSRDILEDPCVSQAPVPILTPPGVCCDPDPCCRNPVGCSDIGCCDPVYCPPPRVFEKKRKPPCEEIPCDPCKLMQECNGFGTGCPGSNRCGGGGSSGFGGSFRGGFSGCGVSSGGGGFSGCGASGGGGGGSCCTGCEDEECGPRQKGVAGLRPNPRFVRCGPEPCEPMCCDPRAHHLNRGPYACPCKPEPDCSIYRCCEPMVSSYTGHIPGFTFHSNGRTTGKATWGTKQYMNKCFYFNTFTKP